ncbi:unnamed protein product, partial [Effrenium voratum]
ELTKLDHIIQQAKEVQDQLLSSVRVAVAAGTPGTVLEPTTFAEPVNGARAANGHTWSFTPRWEKPVRKADESRVRRAAEELLESVRRRALEAEIERLRGELAAAESSKQKLQAEESAETEAGAEAARLLREARVEVNRLKAALHRQGILDKLGGHAVQEAEVRRQGLEQELQAAKEDAERKRDQLQRNQALQDQLQQERDEERRLRMDAEMRHEKLQAQLRQLEATTQEEGQLRQEKDCALTDLREEIRQMHGLVQTEQAARLAAEKKQSTAEGLHRRSRDEAELLRTQHADVLDRAEQEKLRVEQLLESERSLRQDAEQQVRDLQAELGHCRKELEGALQELQQRHNGQEALDLLMQRERDAAEARLGGDCRKGE